MNNESASAEQSIKTSSKVPLLEWCFAAIGLAIFLTACGLLGYKGLVLEHRKPRFKAAAIEIARSGDQYAVCTEIENVGGQTVAKLKVVAEHRVAAGDGTPQLERSDAIIDFLPGHSTRTATFLFTHPLQAQDVRFQFVSYQEP